MRCIIMTKINIQDILLQQLSIPTKLLSHYKSFGLNENEVMVILQIHRFSLNNNTFPTPTDIAAHVTMNEIECANILKKLFQKDLLSIEQSENEQQKLR